MAVNATGDVPQAGSSFSSNSTAPDNNSDNLADWIGSQGNTVLNYLADPDEPTGGSGGSAWDDVLIWTNYETAQNVLIGQDSAGEIEINGGSTLRYQHLILGGYGKFSDNTPSDSGYLNLSTDNGSNDTPNFDYLAQATVTGEGFDEKGIGMLNISGFGSKFSNSPRTLEGDYVWALDQTTTGSSSGVPGTHNRAIDQGFNAHVGLRGIGDIQIAGGGTLDVQNILTLGYGLNSNGSLTVSGQGSNLIVRGEQSPGVVSSNPKSIIGNYGSGVLRIENNGIAKFAQGLECGEKGSVYINDGILSSPIIYGSFYLSGSANFVSEVFSRATISIAENCDITGAILNARKDSSDPTDILSAGSIAITGGTVVFNSPVTNYGNIMISNCSKVIFAGGLINEGTITKGSSKNVFVKTSEGLLCLDDKQNGISYF